MGNEKEELRETGNMNFNRRERRDWKARGKETEDWNNTRWETGY